MLLKDKAYNNPIVIPEGSTQPATALPMSDMQMLAA
jgi:hypothetical protein